MYSSFLSSSIIGREFINYRKNTDHRKREQYSYNIRKEGLGNIPIVIDSVDHNLSLMLSGCDTKNLTRRQWSYGGEFSFYNDTTINDILNELTIILSTRGYNLSKGEYFKLGLEDGTLVNSTDIIGELYKKHRNNRDKILYLLLTKETTVYGYLLSIFKYLFQNLI